MKTRPNEPINAIVSDTGYPVPADKISLGDRLIGLIKRELMAIEFTKATMIGIIAASGTTHHGWTAEEFAQSGIQAADAFINELNKT